MTPSFGYGRGGKVYPYYTSAPLQRGVSRTGQDEAPRRVAAETLHQVITSALGSRLGLASHVDVRDVLPPVRRIDLLSDAVVISLDPARMSLAARKGLEAAGPDELRLTVAVRCRVRGGRIERLGPDGRPLIHRPRRDPALNKGLRRAHQLAGAMGWKAGDGVLVEQQIAAPANPYDRKVVRLAFLAPDLQRAILQGQQPTGLTLQQLLDEPIPLSWPSQRKLFGANI